MRRPVPGWLWLAGSAVAAASFLRFSRKPGFKPDIGPDGLDALARMLVVEHPSGAEAEKAQIVLVAINRARKYDVPVESVVEPGERKVVRSEHGGTWNGGANYALKYATAASSSAYPAALTFVRRVVAGEFPNYGYTAFIHPQRMPTPPCAEGRYALQTFDGPRCVPQWARDPTDKVGIAYFYA